MSAEGQESNGPSTGEQIQDAKTAITSGARAVESGGADIAADLELAKVAVKEAPRAAKKISKGLLIGCLAQVLIFGFVILISINIFNPSISGADETGSGSEGATAGATVPNTVTEMKIGSKTIKIPATKGKSAQEEYLSGMTFSSQCSLKEERWYITMRWPYVKWAWNGHTAYVDSATTSTKPLYATKRIIVYNPDTKKSVVTAICESGPAPWTGSTWAAAHGNDSIPTAPYWPGYFQFDPPEADGRVAGLAPDAFQAIGASRHTVLQYGFAEDQNIPLGPIN